MRLIERKDYVDKLISLKNTPDIKVITGIRRSGKSKLMERYMRWILDEEPEANIISVDLTLLKFESLKEYHALNDYIEARYNPNVSNYVFVDEIQMCEGFELAINSLHSSGNYDIYITGSNAFLLSSDLATLFTGRVHEIEILPFSFKEYLLYYPQDNYEEAFDNYLLCGGMSGGYLYPTVEETYKYIADVFDTVILRDIRQKYKIKNVVLMDRIADFLMDNISNLSSARRIAETLNSNEYKINHKTVHLYMDYLCKAFVFHKVRRYDIRGKKYLASNEKYYLGDHAFRFAKLGTRNLDYGRILENIVAIELIRRGYEIYAGVLYKKEIDFVAMKRDEKIYIQVSDNISEEATLNREITPLLAIKDAYPKYLIARTRHDIYQYEGVQIIDIAKWLVNQ